MLSKAMQHRIAVAGVVGGLAVGAVAVRHQRASKAKTEPCSSIVLPRPIKDAICGAAGEILQILVLYPVEAGGLISGL